MITKKHLTSALFLGLLFILIIENADARIAVGLVWSTEAESVDEDSTYCGKYGAYNPMDEDVDVALVIGGELADFVQTKKSEAVTVKGGTQYQDAIALEACFYVPKIYDEDCIFGLFCKRDCKEEQVNYRGDVSLVQQGTESGGGSGSKMSVGVAAPLRLSVSCAPEERNWVPVIIFIIGIVLVAIVFFLLRYMRKRSSAKGKDIKDSV